MSKETAGDLSGQKVAVIAGAGPAGLTAAYELLDRTDVIPLVFEMSPDIGGISRTVQYKGNRMDIGGHRFFSKSSWVMDWWQNILPLQGAPAVDDLELGRPVQLAERVSQRALAGSEAVERPAPDPEEQDKVMLKRSRLSRILYLRRFFDYPVALNMGTVKGLGVLRVFRIGFSYLRARVRPIKRERSLQDFLINRFGRELYRTFFKDYTEKVWGVPCTEIKPEWGAQRIKGLSISRAIVDAVRSKRASGDDGSIDQKDVETSLIRQFLYPKYGPGQMWEEVSRQVTEAGGRIEMESQVVGVKLEGSRVSEVTVRSTGARASAADVDASAPVDSREQTIVVDYFFSTMPVKELITAIGAEAPPQVDRVARGLVYRDFITVGLLVDRLKIKNETDLPTVGGIVPDNWIYIQESDVRLGRLQIFNNWSPYLVEDPTKAWMGLEYFCDEGDELWMMASDDFAAFAADELAKIGVIEGDAVLDSTVIKVPKTYPAYFGSYDEFDTVREFTDGIENLFLIGRNGMHRYNNQDHSMLSAKVAVDLIGEGSTDKSEIWAVNAEDEYHETGGRSESDRRSAT